jgi:hypothetical protein
MEETRAPIGATAIGEDLLDFIDRPIYLPSKKETW